MSNIEDLKSMVSGRKGLALTNRYQVKISIPTTAQSILISKYGQVAGNAARVLDLMCDATSLPGRQIMTIDYQANKQSIKVPHGFINEDVSFTFLLTGDYYAKKVFDAWSEAIMGFGSYRAKYLETHLGDVEIYQLNKDQTGAYAVKLKNAYPTTFAAIGLENTAENSTQKFAVSMTYENFEYLNSNTLL
jgi:hypothetical protein